MDDGYGMHPMTALSVTVGSTTFQWWSTNHARDRFVYIRSLSVDLIQYKLDAYKAISGPAQVAALRQLQHESGEYLFALLAAYASDPVTLPAWMTLYRNEDVYAFARVLVNNQGGEYDRLMDALLNLEHVPVTIDGRLASNALVQASFYRHLRSIFLEFNDPVARDEYTSTKHSYRIAAGGFKLVMGPENEHVELIRSESSITSTIHERLHQRSSHFGKKDVIVLTSTVAHHVNHVITMIEAIIELTTLVVRSIQSHVTAQATDPVVPATLTHGRVVIRRGAAEPGSGQYVEVYKRFRRLPSGEIEGALTLEMALPSKLAATSIWQKVLGTAGAHQAELPANLWQWPSEESGAVESGEGP